MSKNKAKSSRVLSDENKENINPALINNNRKRKAIAEIIPSKVTVRKPQSTNAVAGSSDAVIATSTAFLELPVNNINVLDKKNYFENVFSKNTFQKSQRKEQNNKSDAVSIRRNDQRQKTVSTQTSDNISEIVLNEAFYSFYSTSPIKPNAYTTRNTLIIEKTSGKRCPKVKGRAVNSTGESKPFTVDIYVAEYIEDIYNYFILEQEKFLLEEDFLKSFNPNIEFRSTIVNWMLKAQQCLKLSDTNYHIAVHLYDQVLALIEVPTNMYQLLALTTLWISSKVTNAEAVKASKLLALCNDVFNKRNLCKMERKVLKILNFDINVVDPLSLLYYYLKLLDVYRNDLVVFAAYYILDCCALMPGYSTIPINLLCAAVVNCALSRFKGKRGNFLEKCIHLLHNANEIKKIENKIFIQLFKMTDGDYKFKEAFSKYSARERQQIAVLYFSQDFEYFITE